MDAVNATETESHLPAGLPDDWVLDRDLPCPKCRYNLRMLSTPRCPECGTVFRWQELLQITCPRCDKWLADVDNDECPRCRLTLDWPRLLEKADTEQLRQFEYTARPVAAAVKVWCTSLSPRRFWKNIRIESPPARRRLRWLLASAVAACLLGLTLAAFANRRVVAAGALDWGASWAIAGLALVLPLFTALALPLFIPTLARFRIRRDQLLRCSAYGCAGLLWIGLVLALAAVGAEIVNTLGWVRPPRARLAGLHFDPLIALRVMIGQSSHGYWQFRGYPLICFNLAVIVLLLLSSFLWWWRHLYVSLRYFLRLDVKNTIALFLSTQLIGVLLVACVLWQWDRFLGFMAKILVRW